jgi:hypothetical protein
LLLEEKCRQYGGSFHVSSRQKNKW